MLNRDEIIKYLELINQKLKQRGSKGQIGLFGGTVMCLVYNARKSTKDIDGVFQPKTLIYEIAKEIARENNLNEDWLNDSVKGFLSASGDTRVYKNFSNLTVYIPSPEYMLAMKCMAARMVASKDIDDIKFLLDYLDISSVDEATIILEKYFPPKLIQPKTIYMLMELLDDQK